MASRLHHLRERLLHGHDNDPLEPHNWPSPVDPLGGNRPFPIPPTPSESSVTTLSTESSASSDEHNRSSTRDRVRRNIEKVRNRSRSRSRHGHRHRHHHRHGEKKKKKEQRGSVASTETRVVIEDKPMTEEEKRERRGSMAAAARWSVNGTVGRKSRPLSGDYGSSNSGSEGGGGVSISGVTKDTAKLKLDVASVPDLAAPMSAPPIITTTPATPDLDPFAHKHVKKRHSTQPIAPAAADISPGRSGTLSRSGTIPSHIGPSRLSAPHQRNSSEPITYPIRFPAPAPLPPMHYSATMPRQRVPFPPYPVTPPLVPMVSGEDYISTSPPSSPSFSASNVHRMPTLLRPGAPTQVNRATSPIPDLDLYPHNAVEIGEGRELRRSDSGRIGSLKSKSGSKSSRSSKSKRGDTAPSPLIITSTPETSLVTTTTASGDLPPTPRSPPTSPSSYRDSILSTFSYQSRSSPSTQPTPIPKSPPTTSLIIPTPASATITSPASRRPNRTLSTRTENLLSILSTFDTVFLIDDSPSMLHGTRWPDVSTALAQIASIATKYDSDGIDIRFLNNTTHDTLNVQTSEHVAQIFSSCGGPVQGGSTPLGARLDSILRPYLDEYRAAKEAPDPAAALASLKPLNIVVLTDGDATDDPESVIVATARELDRLNAPLQQVGIQLFQVGGDKEAAEFLRGLDDDLVGVYGIRDMVDTTPYNGGEKGVAGEEDEGEKGEEEEEEEGFTAEDVLKVLVGGVNRRVDRRANRQ